MTEIQSISVGQRLRAGRKSVHMSHEEVAKVFGCKPTTVSNWERDQNLPETAKLPQLAQMYRVSIDWLLGVGPSSNEEIEHLIDLYRHVPTMHRHTVLRLIRACIEAPIPPTE